MPRKSEKAKKPNQDAVYEFVRRIAAESCYELPGEFPEEGESGHAPCLSCQARAVLEGR